MGTGMLAGAVVGHVFASPSSRHVLAAIRAVCPSPAHAGVLLVVMNYTGDRLNFGVAMSMARAEGLDVRMVVVADDIAFSLRGEGDASDAAAGDAAAGDAAASDVAGETESDSRWRASARGVAGTLLVIKAAGE